MSQFIWKGYRATIDATVALSLVEGEAGLVSFGVVVSIADRADLIDAQLTYDVETPPPKPLTSNYVTQVIIAVEESYTQLIMKDKYYEPHIH